MMRIAFGLAGHALLIATATAAIARRRRWGRWARTLPIVVGLASLVPLAGPSLAGYLLGIFGGLSVTTQVLLALAIASFVSGRECVPESDRRTILASVAATACVLYPLGLGLGGFDPYAAGYGSPHLLGLLALFALAAWFAGRYFTVAIITAALAAQLAGLMESDNLWDYLIDAPLAAYAIGGWLWIAARRLRAVRAAPTTVREEIR